MLHWIEFVIFFLVQLLSYMFELAVTMSVWNIANFEILFVQLDCQFNYQPKNRSMALLTMPELLLGVVGVPVISVAL